MRCAECFVSVVAPLCNDEDIVESFVVDVVNVLRENYTNYEIVLVNDGSSDDTVRKVAGLLSRYECIRLISLSKHCGTEVAITSGLDSVIGDFVVILCPDEDPPALIPELVERARMGKDIIQGVRKNHAGRPWWLRLGSAMFFWLCRSVFGIPVVKDTTQLRVLSRQVLNAITRVDDRHRYLRLLGSYVGYKTDTFPYETLSKRPNPRKRSIWSAVRLGVDILVANSLRPLRWACYLGIFASLANLLYMVYVITVYLLGAPLPPGWTMLSLQISGMFFLISLVLTIMCEYVGVLFEKSKGWTAYYVADEQNSSVLTANAGRRNIVTESVFEEVSNRA